MNERIRELAKQAGLKIEYQMINPPKPLQILGSAEQLEKFTELIVKECNQAVLEVPCYYKDYRSQIEEAVINDCARAVLEHFGVTE